MRHPLAVVRRTPTMNSGHASRTVQLRYRCGQFGRLRESLRSLRRRKLNATAAATPVRAVDAARSAFGCLHDAATHSADAEGVQENHEGGTDR